MLVEAFGSILGLVGIAFFIAKAILFVDCLRHPEGAFPATSKQTKTLWVVLTGASAALQFFFASPIGLFSVAGTIVSLIYFFDVRPAVSQFKKGGGSSGPYGPW